VRAVDHVDATVRGRLAALADALEARSDVVTADVEESIREAIPEFADDSAVAAFREASIGANVTAMLGLVRVGIDAADVVAPDAAITYARELAEQGMPPKVIVRCYRVGQSRFLRHCLEELSRQEIADEAQGRQADHIASIVLIDHISDFIDRVLDQVLTAYEQARDPDGSAAAARAVGGGATDGGDDLDDGIAELTGNDELSPFSRFGPPRAR
jgi:hypothetical protein